LFEEKTRKHGSYEISGRRMERVQAPFSYHKLRGSKMTKVIQDIKAFSDGSRSGFIRTIFLNTNFHCVLFYRISHFFYLTHLSFISQIIKFITRIIYSVDIDYRAELAGGFVLMHGIGVVIGSTVKTSGPVTVYQGVTLGANNKARDYNGKLIENPVILGNNIIYANACILGPVIIGENSIIGAGTIITKDIPSNMKVFSKQELVSRQMDPCSE